MWGGASLGSCAPAWYMGFRAGLDAICHAFIVLPYPHIWVTGGRKTDRVVAVALSCLAQTRACPLPALVPPSHPYTIHCTQPLLTSLNANTMVDTRYKNVSLYNNIILYVTDLLLGQHWWYSLELVSWYSNNIISNLNSPTSPLS